MARPATAAARRRRPRAHRPAPSPAPGSATMPLTRGKTTAAALPQPGTLPRPVSVPSPSRGGHRPAHRDERSIPAGHVPMLHLMRNVDDVRTLADEHHLEFVDLDRFNVDASVCSVIPLAVARRHHVVPIGRKFGAPVVAMSNPGRRHGHGRAARRHRARVRGRGGQRRPDRHLPGPGVRPGGRPAKAATTPLDERLHAGPAAGAGERATSAASAGPRPTAPRRRPRPRRPQLPASTAGRYRPPDPRRAAPVATPPAGATARRPLQRSAPRRHVGLGRPTCRPRIHRTADAGPRRRAATQCAAATDMRRSRRR